MEHDAFVANVREILHLVEYKDWEFEIDPAILALRIKMIVPDTLTGDPVEHYTRWWRLSRFMTRSEVVQTAFKAVITAEEHEIRETFKYRNAAVYGPHMDVEALVGVATYSLDVRGKV